MWIPTLLSLIFSLSLSDASHKYGVISVISQRRLIHDDLLGQLEAVEFDELENEALVDFVRIMIETLMVGHGNELIVQLFEDAFSCAVDDDDDISGEEYFALFLLRIADIMRNMYEGIVDATGDGFPWSATINEARGMELMGILQEAIRGIDDEDDRNLIEAIVNTLTADPSNTELQSGFMAILNRIVELAEGRDAAVQDVREHLIDVFIDAFDADCRHHDDDDDDDDDDEDSDDDDSDDDDGDDDEDDEDDDEEDDDEGDSAEIVKKSKLESGGLNREESGSGLNDGSRGREAVDLSTSSLINIWLSMAIFVFVNVALFWCFVNKYSDKKQMVRFTSRDQSDIDI